MLELSNLGKVKGKKNKKRYGLGFSAGSKTCGRGQKGQLSRAGRSRPYVGFEGGQTPIFRRVPKRGFKNPFRVEYSVVNLSTLNRFEEGTEVTPDLLLEVGIVRRTDRPVKILSNGELEKKLTVKAHGFSQSAIAKISAAGGTAEVI